MRVDGIDEILQEPAVTGLIEVEQLHLTGGHRAGAKLYVRTLIQELKPVEQALRPDGEAGVRMRVHHGQHGEDGDG